MTKQVTCHFLCPVHRSRTVNRGGVSRVSPRLILNLTAPCPVDSCRR